jgi:hypothetical protein
VSEDIKDQPLTVVVKCIPKFAPEIDKSTDADLPQLLVFVGYGF